MANTNSRQRGRRNVNQIVRVAGVELRIIARTSSTNWTRHRESWNGSSIRKQQRHARAVASTWMRRPSAGYTNEDAMRASALNFHMPSAIFSVAMGGSRVQQVRVLLRALAQPWQLRQILRRKQAGRADKPLRR